MDEDFTTLLAFVAGTLCGASGAFIAMILYVWAVLY